MTLLLDPVDVMEPEIELDKAAKDAANRKYQHGWETHIETEKLPKGLSADIIRMISKKKNEPIEILQFRLKAYNIWKSMADPNWAKLNIAPIDYS